MNRRVLTLALVVVAIVAGLQLTGCGRLRGKAGATGPKTTVDLTFIVASQDPALVKAFRIGDPVRIKDSGSLLGKITAVESTPTLMPTATSDGRLVASAVPDQVDIRVSVGEPVWVNSDFKLVSTLTYCEAKVLSITEAGK